MSDELQNMFERLRGQQPPVPFAFPEAVRRRGRQRTHHQALTAGLAVVAVAGAGAGWVVNYGSVRPPLPPGSTTSVAPPRTPPPSPTSPGRSASPSATRTPAPASADLSALLLRAEDLGPGTWQRRQPYEPFSGDLWYWDRAGICPAYRSADYPSLRQQADLEYTGWAIGEATSTSYVYEHVHRYRPGWGPRALDDVRRVLEACPGASPPPSTPGGDVPSRQTIIGRNFAGDESLLIRDEAWAYQTETVIEPVVTLIAVVRVGDLVATVIFSPDRDEAYARHVADAVANRLAG